LCRLLDRTPSPLAGEGWGGGCCADAQSLSLVARVEATLEPAARGAFGLLVFGALAVGVSPIFVRLSDLGPSATAFWRIALALPVFALAIARTDRRPAGLRDHLGLALAGLCFAGDLAVWHWSIRLTSVANSTLLANVAPLFVALISWLALGERFSRGFVGAMAVAFAGVIVLMGGDLELGPAYLIGDGLGLVTAMFLSGYLLSVKRLRARFSTAIIMTYSGVVTALALLAVTLLSGESLLPPGWHGWAVLLGLALLSQAGGQGSVAYALAHLPAAFSSLVMLIEPAAAALFAWILLGEPMGALQIGGGIVILVGIVLARRATRADGG
jgi:drug/metabolite transporter (DMT)-like permease